MTREAAESANWKGKGGKLAFGKTTLFSIVCGKFIDIVFVLYIIGFLILSQYMFHTKLPQTN
jgi:hypothetical protein